MEGNDFEKRSSKKKFIIIGIVALVVVAAIIGVVVFLSLSKKPEKIFSKAVKDIFEIEEGKTQNSMRAELEFSAEVDSDNVNVRAVNEYLKTLKIGMITEIDMEKKILNENINAEFNGEKVISLDALIQDENIYFYLDELFSKYIKVDEEYLEGIDLSMIFEQSEDLDENFIKDLEQILLDEIEEKELEQEKVEIDGKKVAKSTLKLGPKDILKIAKKVLKLVDEYQPMDEIKDLIEGLDYAIEDMGDIKASENYLEISIYTKGFNNKFVKLEMLIVADDEEMLRLEVNKESNEKTTIELINRDEEQVFGFVITEKSKSETTIEFLMNEESTKLKDATKLFEILIVEEDENKGKITFKMDIEDIGTIKVNVKYNIEFGAKIEKGNVRNAISIDELTEDDFMEVYENAQKNEFLKQIIDSAMTDSGLLDSAQNAADQYNDYYYDEEYDYNFDYDYDEEYDYNLDDYEDFNYDWDTEVTASSI